MDVMQDEAYPAKTEWTSLLAADTAQSWQEVKPKKPTTPLTLAGSNENTKLKTPNPNTVPDKIETR